jgi:TolB-like protein/class 3 adenylate cyclase
MDSPSARRYTLPMTEGMRRKLAAIVAADVVGYSRLMGEDEAGTLAALRKWRSELFAPAVRNHRGNIVKNMGDGWLVAFNSAMDAVTCAIEVQESLSGHETLKLRIGLHIGDITHVDDDIYGDGVNIAARLQGIAEPGAIVISDVTRRSIDGKLAAGFADLGLKELKNITGPIAIYGWGMLTAQAGSAALQLPDKPSIAVLPFANMSGDPEQEYFSDGISEDIITDLSKIADLFVIARNSSFSYKGQSINIPSVAGELGVRYILEGSVRRGGDRVRVNAQLIDAASGGHLWAERYDGDLTDIFAMQDEVTANIVQALAVTLRADEERRVGQKGTDNLAAYELMLRGREFFLRTNYEGTQLAKEVLEQAIELDSGFGLAYAYLSHNHNMDYVNGWSEDPQASLRRAHELAKRGVELMPDDAHVHVALAGTLVWLRRHDEAIAEAERALELDPNYAHGQFELGRCLLHAGRAAEALKPFDQAVRLDPHHADQFLHFMAQANFQLGRYDAAIDLLRRRIIRHPQSDSSRMFLASCLGHLNRYDEARVVWDEIKVINPDFSLEQRRGVLPYKNPENFEQIVDGLRQAGLPEA